MNNISYRQNIIEKIDGQIEKGKSKYGQVLEDNDLTMDEKLDHLQEELIDGLFYIEHLREERVVKMIYDTYGVKGNCRGCGKATEWHINGEYPVCKRCINNLIEDILANVNNRKLIYKGDDE